MSLEEAAVLLAAEDGMGPAPYRAEAEKIRASRAPRLAYVSGGQVYSHALRRRQPDQRRKPRGSRKSGIAPTHIPG